MRFSELRLSDLGGLVNLLHQIANFKSKVMGASLTAPENVFRECIKGLGSSNFRPLIVVNANSCLLLSNDPILACASSTYTYIFNNCNQLHAREFGEDQNKEQADQEGPSPQSLDFWVKLCTLSGIITVLYSWKKSLFQHSLLRKTKQSTQNI